VSPVLCKAMTVESLARETLSRARSRVLPGLLNQQTAGMLEGIQGKRLTYRRIDQAEDT